MLAIVAISKHSYNCQRHYYYESNKQMFLSFLLILHRNDYTIRNRRRCTSRLNDFNIRRSSQLFHIRLDIQSIAFRRRLFIYKTHISLVMTHIFDV